MVVSSTVARSAKVVEFAHMVVKSTVARSAKVVEFAHMVVKRINARYATKASQGNNVSMVVEKIVAKIVGGLASVHMVVSRSDAKIAVGLPSVHMAVKKVDAWIVESSACHASVWWAKKTSGVMIANQFHLAGPRSKRRALLRSLGSGRLKDAFPSTLHGIVPTRKAKGKSVARTGLISHGILGIGL
jgi:hypothetical protein